MQERLVINIKLPYSLKIIEFELHCSLDLPPLFLALHSLPCYNSILTLSIITTATCTVLPLGRNGILRREREQGGGSITGVKLPRQTGTYH